MDSKTVGVAIASVSTVVLLSVVARRSRSAAEIEPLSAFDPATTYVGERRPLLNAPSMWPGTPYELLGADGSVVRVGDGLTLDRGVLSVRGNRPRTGAMTMGSQDVFLL